MIREPTNGAEIVAKRLEDIGRGEAPANLANPLGRLRDTIVFGYLMQTPKDGRVDVPEWYVNGLEPNKRLAASCCNLAEELAAEGAWDVLEGGQGG